MEPALNPKSKSAIREEAAEWLLARREGLSQEKLRQFTRWLATSPTHLAEYHAMEKLGRELPLAVKTGATVDQVVERAREQAADVVVPIATARDRRPVVALRAPRWAMAAACAFVAVGVIVLAPRVQQLFQPPVREMHFAAGPGEPRERTLDDESRLKFDPGSAVIVQYTKNARSVTLDSGLASNRVGFEVRHDEDRRFVVVAGAARIEDLGTKFDVYLKAGVTQITVMEGSVEVSNVGLSGTRTLVAGEQITVVPGQALALPSDEVLFDDVPLGRVAAEVNHYVAKPILIQSHVLDGMNIHYRFRVSDVSLFLNFLRTQGMQVDEESDRILVKSP